MLDKAQKLMKNPTPDEFEETQINEHKIIKQIKDRISNTMQNFLNNGILKDDFKVEVVEDDDNTKLVRKIMEEEKEEIMVKIQIHLIQPLKYIQVTFQLDDKMSKIKIP